MEGIPTHIGIIPDGNRRFAKKLLQQPWKGHEWGTDRIKKTFEWCKESGIKIMTFYALSLENLTSRPQDELGFLFALAKRELKEILTDKSNFVHKNNVRMRFFGRLDLLPSDVQDLIDKVHKATSKYNDYHMNVAMAYGGRQEIVEACRKIGSEIAGGKMKPCDIDEAVMRQHFWTNGHPDPDLIIRTGNEKRISNFLLFQSAYSELKFVRKFWPDFGKEDFKKVINEYSRRERRFGK